ncbi:hypothetical protein BV392_00815 [Rhodovulum sulfidophilum]|nr:hypothetical protein BV392_00815 [Rhodovulum sulfidophilum]
MYEMLEVMEVPLGQDGELSMPIMFISPYQRSKVQAQIEAAGAEFEIKFSALKDKKKAEAQDRERKRLSLFERIEK